MNEIESKPLLSPAQIRELILEDIARTSTTPFFSASKGKATVVARIGDDTKAWQVQVKSRAKPSKDNLGSVVIESTCVVTSSDGNGTVPSFCWSLEQWQHAFSERFKQKYVHAIAAASRLKFDGKVVMTGGIA